MGQGNWKFLLPLRFHFTPNHTTMAGSILNALLMPFATVTVVDIFKTASGDRVTTNQVGANLDEIVEEIVKN